MEEWRITMGLRFKGDIIREEEQSLMDRVVINNWKDAVLDIFCEIADGAIKGDLPDNIAIAQLACTVSEMLIFMEPEIRIKDDRIPKLEDQKKQIQGIRENVRNATKKVEVEDADLDEEGYQKPLFLEGCDDNGTEG